MKRIANHVEFPLDPLHAEDVKAWKLASQEKGSMIKGFSLGVKEFRYLHFPSISLSILYLSRIQH